MHYRRSCVQTPRATLLPTIDDASPLSSTLAASVAAAELPRDKKKYTIDIIIYNVFYVVCTRGSHRNNTHDTTQSS